MVRGRIRWPPYFSKSPRKEKIMDRIVASVSIKYYVQVQGMRFDFATLWRPRGKSGTKKEFKIHIQCNPARFGREEKPAHEIVRTKQATGLRNQTQCHTLP